MLNVLLKQIGQIYVKIQYSQQRCIKGLSSSDFQLKFSFQKRKITESWHCKGKSTLGIHRQNQYF